MQREYNYLSSLISSVEGSTIEKYMINLKIERVKELLVYDEKTLSEIAFELRYSSVCHLSGQFKKVTGFTPTYFKNWRNKNENRLIPTISNLKML
jgi:AraC family transcriptional regulator